MKSNERRTTQSGPFTGATRRAGAIFLPSGVIRYLCNAATLRVFCLAGQKNAAGRPVAGSVNRPWTTDLSLPAMTNQHPDVARRSLSSGYASARSNHADAESVLLVALSPWTLFPRAGFIHSNVPSIERRAVQ